MPLFVLAVPAALLRAAQQNPRMKEFLSSGWEASWELCVGVPTSETFWTGVECLDPINKPGVVRRM